MGEMSGKTKFCTKKLIAFFTEVMKWSLGVDFHVCTLQVMLASILGGSTVHHLAGLTPFSKQSVLESNIDAHLASEPLQSRLLLCRVIFIDEVFMLSAQFLAQVESELRNGVSDTSPYKYGADGTARPWGGLNMGFIGDAYQLDCPEGTPLYKVPESFLPPIPQSAAVPKGDPPESTLASRGLELMWQSVQGVTELIVAYRSKDTWWNSVLNHIRVLQLSDDDYAFLHGTETTVPGSWLKGKPECPNGNCAALQEKWKSMVERGASWEARRRNAATTEHATPVNHTMLSTRKTSRRVRYGTRGRESETTNLNATDVRSSVRMIWNRSATSSTGTAKTLRPRTEKRNRVTGFSMASRAYAKNHNLSVPAVVCVVGLAEDAGINTARFQR